MAYEKMRLQEACSRCLLCSQAACQQAYGGKTDLPGVIRSIRFDNYEGALAKVAGRDPEKERKAMQACRRRKIDRPVPITEILDCLQELAGSGKIPEPDRQEKGKPDLSITSMGVRFENPFLLSSSVVGSNEEMIAKAFEMGWAGVAGKTIGMFTPQEASPRFSALRKESNPFVGFKNIEQISTHPLEENLMYIRHLKKRYPEKVFLASIMGSSEAEWTELAARVEDAGADLIECNFSCPQMVGEQLGSDVGTDPRLVYTFTQAVRRGTSLPILAKMTPNITDMTVAAKAAVGGGADGIAAINTIKSVMNVDLDSFASEPDVGGRSCVGGYSGKAVKPIALRFITDLAKDPELCSVPVSGMGGIETWRDAAEFLACGCDTVQITTAVMQYGYRIIEDLLDGMIRYLQRTGISSVRDLVGKALDEVVPTDALDRKTVSYPKFNRQACVGCGRCSISCFDGGHQAIVMEEKPRLNSEKCVGCQLCRLVCPAGAISAGARVMPRIHAR